jgi:hypothetical protein
MTNLPNATVMAHENKGMIGVDLTVIVAVSVAPGECCTLVVIVNVHCLTSNAVLVKYRELVCSTISHD